MPTATPEPPKGYRAPLACFITGGAAFFVFAPVAVIAAGVCLLVHHDEIGTATYAGMEVLRAFGADVDATRPGGLMEDLLVGSVALASLGLFLVLTATVWSIVRFGPRQRVSRIWRAHRAAALPAAPAPQAELRPGPAPAATVFSAGDPLDATPPEVWQGPA